MGLKLTKIYQVVEYEGGQPFKQFVNNVVEARRKGDENPESSVVAETIEDINEGKKNNQKRQEEHQRVRFSSHRTLVHCT